MRRAARLDLHRDSAGLTHEIGELHDSLFLGPQTGRKVKIGHCRMRRDGIERRLRDPALRGQSEGPEHVGIGGAQVELDMVEFREIREDVFIGPVTACGLERHDAAQETGPVQPGPRYADDKFGHAGPFAGWTPERGRRAHGCPLPMACQSKHARRKMESKNIDA
jgi:hypothetical protein